MAFPPPWQLCGRGYILLCRFPTHRLAATGTLPPALAQRFDGGLGAVMFVDYAQSPVGPYRELLVIPGYFRGPLARARAVTRIWVTSESSMVAGRENWGLPKELATCDWKPHETTGDRISFGREGRELASIEFRHTSKIPFPITSALVPRSIRALEQPWEGAWVRTIPKASGRVMPARIESLLAPGIPELDPSVVLSAWHIPQFRLTFGHPTRRMPEPA